MKQEARIIAEARAILPKRFPGWAHTQKFREFEREYGKYLVIPLDVEPIVPDDVPRFKEWFASVSIPTTRVRADIAGNGSTKISSFQTVDSEQSQNPIWKENVCDVFAEFPELAQKAKQLPFVKPPSYRVWSSTLNINPHRDTGPWVDAPVGFRSVMYDENPTQSLFLCEDPVRLENHPRRKISKVPRASQTFGWNNIRTMHYSMFNPKFRKAIMIFHNELLDLDRCANLFDRSISKFTKSCWTSDLPSSAFY